ncbi:hypothetical protein [Paenibacillus sp. OSY-SE]|nr:hypothetical protein [Paenibacillus sp. OSY-SE]
MKKLMSKVPILLVLTLLSIGLINSDDTISLFGGGVPWIVD